MVVRRSVFASGDLEVKSGLEISRRPTVAGFRNYFVRHGHVGDPFLVADHCTVVGWVYELHACCDLCGVLGMHEWFVLLWGGSYVWKKWCGGDNGLFLDLQSELSPIALGAPQLNTCSLPNLASFSP